MGNLIVIGILSIVVFLVVRSMWEQRKNPKQCTGDCSSCGSTGCHHDWEAIRKEIKLKEQMK